MVARWLSVAGSIASALILMSCGGTPTQPTTTGNDACDPALWAHVWQPDRLTIISPCRTVTGVVTDMHSNEDGDFDIRLAVDPAYANLPNAQNVSELNGHLQLEAICQAPILTTDGMQSCGTFKGTVLLPSVGQHISATGPYVLDTNHGWTELHPLSVIRVLQP